MKQRTSEIKTKIRNSEMLGNPSRHGIRVDMCWKKGY